MAEESRIAVFVDFENLAIGTRDMHGGEFRIDLVQKRLLEKGRIVFKRAYCDWNRYRGAVRDFHANGIEMIDIPSGRLSGKNSADIRMVVDALDLCHSKGHIDIFALLTGDSDFSPLVNKLKENNKRVIGCGVKSSTSDLLVASCDEFLYYDELVRSADNMRRQRGPDGRSSRPSGTAASLTDATVERIDTAAAAEAGTETPRPRRKSRGRRSSKSRGTAVAMEIASQDAIAGEPADETRQPAAITEFLEESATPSQEAAAAAEAPEEAAPARRKASKKKATAKAAKDANEGKEDKPTEAVKPSRTTKASRSKTKAAKEATDDEAKDDESSAETAPGKAPRPRRASSKAKAEPEPAAETKIDLASEAVDRLVAIVTSLSQDYDPVWGSLAKQTLHRVHPDFSEERYGYAGFKDLLLEAEKRGYVVLEYDQARGNYKIRVKA